VVQSPVVIPQYSACATIAGLRVQVSLYNLAILPIH
jgi:hypothetical protein